MCWPAKRAVLNGRENSAEPIGSQILVFGWLSHLDASLEMLASMATLREVKGTDTAIHKRFTKACAHFLHAVFEEMVSVVVEASHEVPLELLSRFQSVVLEESSSIALPEELAEQWQGCGGSPGKGQGSRTDASLIDPVRLKKRACRWEVCISQTWAISIGEGLLLAERLGVTRSLVPRPEPTTGHRKANHWNWMRSFQSRVGQTHECWVRVGKDHRHLMRLLIKAQFLQKSQSDDAPVWRLMPSDALNQCGRGPGNWPTGPSC